MLRWKIAPTANVFYSDYDDMQLSYDLTAADPTDFSFIVKNAPKAETYGAEVGANATLTPELSVYGSIGLLHAKITEYPGSGFQGNELPRSPSATASMGVSFDRDRWEASFDTRYSASYYSDIETIRAATSTRTGLRMRSSAIGGTICESTALSTICLIQADPSPSSPVPRGRKIAPTSSRRDRIG
jgi:outer membrane receptor protein involved in Fe transport